MACRLAGETFEDLLAEYDDLSHEDLLAALEYAASVAGGPQARPFVA